MSELNSSTLFYHVKKEYQSRNIQNHMYTTIKRTRISKIFLSLCTLFLYIHILPCLLLRKKKYFQQRHEKSTCKLMPIVGGFVYFLRLDLIEVLRHKSPLEMTNFSDPNNSGNGSTTNFFSIGGTKKTE